MEEVDVHLTEAEQARVTWTPVQDLVIESLHEQMDELKVGLERVSVVTLLIVTQKRFAVPNLI